MVTSEIFDKLMTLQDILVQKYETVEKKEAAPKMLQSQKELLASLQQEYIAHSEEAARAREHITELKRDLQDAEFSRERGERSMDSVSSHREYEMAERQINESADKEQVSRRELQQEEKRLAELSDRLKSEEELIESQKDELKRGEASIAEEIAEYDARLEALVIEENNVNQDIDPEIIFKFERIIKNKQSKGIVPVKGNVCDGCHMILPAQFANKVHSGEEILFCPYCSRILYYQEVDIEDTEYFHVEETGSLSNLDGEFGEDEIDETEESEELGEDSAKEIDFDE